MNITDLVSVIVPIFNVDKFLKRCVDSVLSQTYANLQVILVDDGSTDNCPALCDEYKKKDNRIIVIHKENGGLSDARNAGISIASGSYYAFIDSDDYISVNAIHDMLYKAKCNNCEIAICNMIRFFDNDITEPFYKPVENTIVLENCDRFETLLQPSVCNKLFDANLFKNVRFPKGKFYEDTFVYHELLFKANKVVLTGSDDYWYYLRGNSILGDQKITEKYFDFIQAVYNRTIFLYKNNVHNYDLQAFFSFYAAISNIIKKVEKTDKNSIKFSESFNMYNDLYDVFMNDEHFEISVKQKIRLFLLRYLPFIHKWIF